MATKEFTDRETGQVVVVDDGQVQLRNKQGSVFQVPVSEYKKALAENPDLAPATRGDVTRYDKERPETATSALGAYYEGSARGVISGALALPKLATKVGSAVLGTEDPLEDVTGQGTLESIAYLAGEATGASGEQSAREYREAAQERARLHPVLKGVGELQGEYLGSAGIGAAGKVAGKVAGMAAGKVLPKVASKAASVAAGATEGAIYSGGAAIEQAAFEDRELSGEQLAAAMGTGAIVGGGVGLVFDGVRGVLKRSGTRGATPMDSPRAAAPTPSGGIREALEEFSDRQTAKALGIRPGEVAKRGKDKVGQMAQAVRDYKLKDGRKVFQAFDGAEERATKVLEARNEVNQELGNLRNRASKFIEEKAPDLAPDMRRISDRIKKEILTPLETSGPTGNVRRAALVRKELERMDEVLRPPEVVGMKRQPGGRGAASVLRPERPVTVDRLTQYRIGLDNQIYRKTNQLTVAPEHMEQLEQMRHIVEDEIAVATDKASARMGDKFAGKYTEIKQLSRSFYDATTISGREAARDYAAPTLGLKDYGGAAIGAMATGGAGAVPSAMIGAVVSKATREHAAAVLAVAADRLAKNFDVKMELGLRKFFERHAPKAVKSAAKAEVSKAPAGEASKVIPLPKLKPSTEAPAAAAGLAAIPAMKAFLGSEKDEQKAYRNRVSEIMAVTGDNGQEIHRKVAESLGEFSNAAPGVAMAAGVTTQRAMQFLASKIPQYPSAPSPLNPSRTVAAPPTAIRSFARTWAATNNPLSVLDDLQRGNLSFEAVDALRNVYPRIYQRLQERVLTVIRERDMAGRPLPYQAKLRLDLLLNLGGAGEPILDPMLGMRISEIRGAKAQQTQQTLAPSARRPPELSQSMRSGLEQTQARAVAMGR